MTSSSKSHSAAASVVYTPPYSAVQFVRRVRRDPLGFFLRLSRDGGDVVGFRLAGSQVFMLNKAEHIKHVLQDNASNYRKSKFYKPLYPILGKGIFTAEGDAWLRQRRLGVKAVQGPNLKRMTGTMTAAISDMLERWNGPSSAKRAVDIVPEMMRVTLDILLRTLFSTKLESDRDPVYEALTVALSHAERRIWSVASPPDWLPTAGNLSNRRALAVLDSMVDRILTSRLAEPDRHDDFLSALLRAQPQDISDDSYRRLIRDEVLSMILAGHETTANALAWTWFLLSKHPTVECQLRAEIATVLGQAAPTPDDVSALRYTRAVFDESMRLYPPVWTISRDAVADDRVDDIEIPRGSSVMICAYAVHRREAYWPNPEGFDPSRFLEPEAEDRPRFAYFPFSMGPRNCLGRHFAALEAMLILPMVLQRFRLDLVPGYPVEPEPMITLRPRDGIHMRLHPAPHGESSALQQSASSRIHHDRRRAVA